MKTSVFLILAIVVICQLYTTNCQLGEGEENTSSVLQPRWGEGGGGHGRWHHRHWRRPPWNAGGPPGYHGHHGHHGHHGYHGHHGHRDWRGHDQSPGCHHQHPESGPGSPPHPLFPGDRPPGFVPTSPSPRPGGYPGQRPDDRPPGFVPTSPSPRPGGYPSQRPGDRPPGPPPTTAPQRPVPETSKELLEPGNDYGLDVRFQDADEPQH